MPSLKFTVEGTPRPKSLNTGGRRPFNNAAVKAWMADVKTATGMAMRENRVDTIPAGVPVRVLIYAFFEWPKSTPKKLIEQNPYAPLAGREDWDNLAKPICDGMTQAQLWADDRQVWRGAVEKRRCPRGESAAEILIQW